MSPSSPVQLVWRGAIVALASVLISFLVAWLVGEVPALGVVVGVLTVAMIGWSIVRMMRAPNPLTSLATTAGVVAIALVLAMAIDAVVGSDGTIPVAASEIEPTAGPTVGPTSAVTPSVVPTATSPSSTATAELTATEIPTAGFGEITDLHVDLDDNGTVVTLDTDGAPVGEVWVFSTVAPAEPVVVVQDGRGAEVRRSPSGVAVAVVPSTTALTITLTGGPDGGGWAAVRDGIRTPDSGHTSVDGVIVRGSDQAESSRAIEAQIAAVQLAIPDLAADMQAYVLSLLGRQLTPGTFTMRRSSLDATAPDADLVFTSDGLRFSQTLATDESIGLWLTPDGPVTCGADGCRPSPDARFPLDAAVAVVGDPGGLELRPLPDAAFGGRPAACVEVVATPADGPSVGTTCWLPDGRPTLLERPGAGDRLELVSVTPEPHPTRLDPPE